MEKAGSRLRQDWDPGHGWDKTGTRDETGTIMGPGPDGDMTGSLDKTGTRLGPGVRPGRN